MRYKLFQRAAEALRRRIEEMCQTCPVHGFRDCHCEKGEQFRKAFAEAKALELFGRADVPQVLLIHTLALNADTLDALLVMFERRGYRFITLDAALRDKAYGTPDVFAGRNGPSWLFRWSRTIAPTSSFREDPEVPAWVTALYQAAQGR